MNAGEWVRQRILAEPVSPRRGGDIPAQGIALGKETSPKVAALKGPHRTAARYQACPVPPFQGGGVWALWAIQGDALGYSVPPLRGEDERAPRATPESVGAHRRDWLVEGVPGRSGPWGARVSTRVRLRLGPATRFRRGRDARARNPRDAASATAPSVIPSVRSRASGRVRPAAGSSTRISRPSNLESLDQTGTIRP